MRFEEEYPEEAATLMQLCSDKTFREEAQRLEATLPPAERIYPNVQATIKTETKVKRNDPCPCGSNKKYKKCCGGN